MNPRLKYHLPDIAIATVILAFALGAYNVQTNEKRGPWYLGCTDGTKEYLMKVDDKPRIRDGIIHIGKDTFVTPAAGMTCRIVRVSDVEKDVDKVETK